MNIHSIYRPISGYFRRKRMRQFCQLFDVTDQTRILDVGGNFFNWSLMDVRPKLSIINLYGPQERERPDVVWVVADARHLPFKDHAFDIAYSNSVIEHLATADNQRAFAKEVTRVGVSYYVQTPDRRFVIEPHLLTPFIHWLPRSWRRTLLRNFTVWGWITRPNRQQCEDFVEEVQLLDATEIQHLFPQGKIVRERLLGYTKSLIALQMKRQL